MVKTIEIDLCDLEELKKENKSLKEQIESRQEEVERFKQNAMADMKEITDLEIENKNLKAELKQLEERYDRNAELYKRLLEENKNLKDIIRKAKTFEYSDEQMHYIFENTKDL